MSVSAPSLEKSRVFESKIVIDASLIDSYGHMNNSKYLEVLENARWDIISQRGFGPADIAKHGLGPVVLEVNLRFTKEIKLAEKIKIVSYIEMTNANGTPVEKSKTMTMVQSMINEAEDVCCAARFVFGLFDLKARKLVLPTPEWLRAAGVTD